MDRQAWQRLMMIESRDGIERAFQAIHRRSLSARRAKEISSAARQAREFFRNAGTSNFSVKPLLTFYGVACLSRALVLLLRKGGGEESLTKGHGLETSDWSAVLSGDLSEGLERLGDLRVRLTNGLFADLVQETGNRLCVHVNSSAVDWRLEYPVPSAGAEVTLEALLRRTPDLMREFAAGERTSCASVSKMTFSNDEGFFVSTPASALTDFQQIYHDAGYTLTVQGETASLRATAQVFSENMPQLSHTYVDKMFGSIPSLHLVDPYPDGTRFSQIASTYLIAYFLGMLSRYYPTHWTALVQGEKGDRLWPTLNRAQYMVESAFPELIMELIDDFLKTGNKHLGASGSQTPPADE